MNHYGPKWQLSLTICALQTARIVRCIDIGDIIQYIQYFFGTVVETVVSYLSLSASAFSTEVTISDNSERPSMDL